MKYKFKNGAEVTGTIDQILSVAKGLGETVNLDNLSHVPRGYYKSSTKGVLKISDMHNTHIRSALLKMSRQHFEGMAARTAMTNLDFCKNYLALGENPIVEDLFNELAKRSK